ncbi:MAG: U32 family peptidase [Desulfobacterales bacterium]|nr:U32 family peptidase [Desulfobacterales bacterium]
MLTKTDRIELLAPAGNFEKLEVAIHFGADAVYLGGKDYSLRNFSGNFTLDELRSAAALAHAGGVRVYLACNIYSRNAEQPAIRRYLEMLSDMEIDGLIVSDPGIIAAARQIVPHIPLHLSTQANTTNYNSALFWKNQGIKRIVMARELSLAEAGEMVAQSGLEVEAFVHGAMCISYSGRCLLSNFMANRDSNQGMCCHPCRWKYAVMEETRPGQYMPISEDERGTYIFNSSDLSMIAHIPELIQTGLTALKIEGRMKGIHYVAATVKVYREAIDAYYKNPLQYEFREEWLRELNSISHRGYSTGFYFGEPDGASRCNGGAENESKPLFIAKVLDPINPQQVKVDARNKFFKGDRVEILKPGSPVHTDIIAAIFDENGHSIPCAQPGSKVSVSLGTDCARNDLIRKAGGHP